jgi:hypothetical protein
MPMNESYHLPNGNVMIAVWDPCNHFPNIPKRRLLEACGFIPSWVSQLAASEQFTEGATLEKVKAGLHAFYQRGWQTFDGFTMNEDGTLTYAGDPPQFPLIRLEMPTNVEVFQYENAWVAIREKDTGKHEISRMD